MQRITQKIKLMRDLVSTELEFTVPEDDEMLVAWKVTHGRLQLRIKETEEKKVAMENAMNECRRELHILEDRQRSEKIFLLQLLKYRHGWQHIENIGRTAPVPTNPARSVTAHETPSATVQSPARSKDLPLVAPETHRRENASVKTAAQIPSESGRETLSHENQRTPHTQPEEALARNILTPVSTPASNRHIEAVSETRTIDRPIQTKTIVESVTFSPSRNRIPTTAGKINATVTAAPSIARSNSPQLGTHTQASTAALAATTAAVDHPNPTETLAHKDESQRTQIDSASVSAASENSLPAHTQPNTAAEPLSNTEHSVTASMVQANTIEVAATKESLVTTHILSTEAETLAPNTNTNTMPEAATHTVAARDHASAPSEAAGTQVTANPPISHSEASHTLVSFTTAEHSHESPVTHIASHHSSQPTQPPERTSTHESHGNVTGVHSNNDSYQLAGNSD